jgi:ElaB/YqjD/DUF883 family membrane-anchored ribosome-binding protein
LASDSALFEFPDNFEEILAEAAQASHEKAEGIYYEFKTNWEIKLKEMQERLEKYFQDKADSLTKIAIDNIREAKLKEIEKNKILKLQELSRSKQILPSLSCEQIAYVEFSA